MAWYRILISTTMDSNQILELACTYVRQHKITSVMNAAVGAFGLLRLSAS